MKRRCVCSLEQIHIIVLAQAQGENQGVRWMTKKPLILDDYQILKVCCNFIKSIKISPRILFLWGAFSQPNWISKRWKLRCLGKRIIIDSALNPRALGSLYHSCVGLFMNHFCYLLTREKFKWYNYYFNGVCDLSTVFS